MNTAFDYKTELNQLRFTPEEKAAMTDRPVSYTHLVAFVAKAASFSFVSMS